MGAGQQLHRVLPHHRDVAELAAGPHRLAVQVHLDPGVGLHRGTGARGELGRIPSEEVHHHGAGCEQIGGPEREVGHGAKVLLELAGDRCVHGPVAGVVRPHRELVDQHGAVCGLEQLHGEHPGHPEVLRDRGCEPLDAVLGSLVEVGSWSHHLVAHAVALDGLHHGVGGRLPAGPAGHLCRELPCERHLLLGEQLSVLLQPIGGVLGALDDAHAVPVVPAARGLHHQRAVVLGERAVEILDAAHVPPAGARMPQLGEAAAHHQLVLGVHQGTGTRTHLHVTVGDQSLQERRRDVLVVEGEHVHLGGESAHGALLVMTARAHAAGDHGGALCGIGGQHGQRQVQFDRGPQHHPGQLPSAHHPDPGWRGQGRARGVIRHVRQSRTRSWPRCGGCRPRWAPRRP